jgi:hypothetical protein
LVQDGFIQVPEKPGLGFDDLNPDVVNACIDPDNPGYFEASDIWDTDRSWDRLWS